MSTWYAVCRAAAKVVELAASEQDWTPRSSSCIPDLTRMASRCAGAENDAPACQALLALAALHNVHLAGEICPGPGSHALHLHT